MPEAPALFAADAATREVSGLLLPFNEMSQPNVSGTQPCMFTAATQITLPEDPTIAPLFDNDHDRHSPRGVGVMFSIDPARGVVATFRVGKGPQGDAFLQRATDPTKPKLRLSAEVGYITRDLDGVRVTSTAVTGGSIASQGAFESAALFSLADVEAITAAQTALDAAQAALDTAAETVQNAHAGDAENVQNAQPTDPEPGEEGETPTTSTTTETENNTVPEAPAAVVPGTIPAAPAAPEDPQAQRRRESALFAASVRPALARLGTGMASETDRQLAQRFFTEQGALFALSDIDYDGVGGVGAKTVQPQWLGENRGPGYISRFVPLFNSAPLTQLAMGGFKWGVKPAGGTWAGNKEAIPSNTPTIVPETENATRWAGGHDIAREHKDFGTPGFFESYDYWMRRSFEEWLDKSIVLVELLAGATDIVADDPTGLDIGPAMSAIIDGAAEVINAGYTPTFATMDTDYWKTIAKTPRADMLAYLNAQLSLRLDGENFVDSSTFRIVPAPVGTVTAEHVVVGSKDAATVYTLPGVPIRAEAINISNGGLDYGYFGYGGLKIENAAAIVDVAPAA